MSESRQKLLTWVALASVGLLVADRLVLSPLAHHWQEQGIRITELRESLDRGALLLDREETLRERWAEMQAEAIPADASDAENEVLHAASRWARESRVLLTGLIPQWRRHKARYETLECRVTAEGDLASITRFLRALEADPLAVRLETCDLVAQDDHGRELLLQARFSALRLPPTTQAAP